MFPLMMLFGTALLAALIVTYLMPTKVGVTVGCATVVVQLYTVSIAGIYVAVGVLAWLALWRSALVNNGFWRWPWAKALAVLLFVRFMSLAWSPNPVLGIRTLIYSLPLLFAAQAFYTLTNEERSFARRWLTVLLASTAFEAVLTVIFRVSPAIEFHFLKSPIARFFISENALVAFFTIAPDNVYDPAKAGGVFLNANVAAIFLGVSALASWHFGASLKSALLRNVAVLDLIAVFFAGSKAGILFAIAVPTVIWLFSTSNTRRFNPRVVVMGILGAAVLPIALLLIWPHLGVSRFEHDAADTLNSREAIWGFMRTAFPAHPILGLGFGGWEKTFPIYGMTHGVSPKLPPHNSALIMWAQSGIPAVLAGAAWIFLVGAAAVKAFYTDFETRQLGLGVAGAFVWYVSQGMAENIGWIGEVHLTPLLGVLLGYMCAICDEKVVQRNEPRVTGTARSVTSQPAISPV